jgi:putative nucleotidyltransferase with HDIG domain
MTHPQAFDNDPLRILRAFRFAADLGFTIDAETLDAMKHAVPSLAQVSVERIMNELLLTFGTPEASSAVAALDRYGILDSVFPEIIMMKGCDQNGYHHKDVWGHSLLVVERLEDILDNSADYFDDAAAVFRNLEADARLPLLKLAALLHDVGKPGTKGLNQETGRITFKKHDKAGAEHVDRIAERMKLSGQARTFLVRMVLEHLQPIFLSAASVSPAARMRWFRQMGDDAVPALILSMADVMSSRGPLSGEEYRSGFVAWCRQQINDYYVSVKTILARPVLITGHDLMALGMTPGPEIGRVLGQVREAQDTGDISSRDEALTLVRKLAETFPS